MDYVDGDHENGRPGLRMAVWSQVKVCGRRLSLLAANWLYARSVCDTKSATAAAVCGLWRYISVICLCLVNE